MLARHQTAKTERVARARERSDRRLRHTLEPFLFVTDDCGEPPTSMKVKIPLRFICNERVLLLNRLSQAVDIESFDAVTYTG